MQLTDMLASYQNVSQHQGLAQQEVEQTPAKGQRNKQQAQQSNTASVVSISFEANRMREQTFEIMQQYDLKQISQRDMDTLATTLFNTEVINSQQYATLSYFNNDNINGNDAENSELFISPEQPQNMIDKWQQRLTHLREIKAKPIAQQQAVNMVNLLNNLQANRH